MKRIACLVLSGVLGFALMSRAQSVTVSLGGIYTDGTPQASVPEFDPIALPLIAGSTANIAALSNSWYSSPAFTITSSNIAQWIAASSLFSGAGTTGLVTSTAADTLKFLRGDGAWQSISFVETDPLFTGWLGTNAYVKVETDPVWSAMSNDYYTTANTNGYLSAESDPVFTNWLSTNAYIQHNSYTNTTTLEMTNAVSFPNGIYLAGTYLDGTTGQLAIAYVAFDNDFIPTRSNAFDIGSLEYPVRDLYLDSNSVYMAGEKVLSYSNGDLVVSLPIVQIIGTNAPTTVANTNTALILGTSWAFNYVTNDGGRFDLTVNTNTTISETDPVFTNWLGTNAYVKTETDPIASAFPTSNWNTAYSWGNHATNNYQTVTEVTNAINGFIAGTGKMLMLENGSTSILYHVTSSGVTNKIGEFWTE
jgi:hypothetical protein